MAKHTQGPWVTSATDDTVVVDATGLEVAAIDGDYNDPDTWPQMEANARLIAAAPEMLEALKATVASLVAAVSLLKRGSKKAAPSNTVFDMMVSDYEKAVELGRAAIINAEGGE